MVVLSGVQCRASSILLRLNGRSLGQKQAEPFSPDAQQMYCANNQGKFVDWLTLAWLCLPKAVWNPLTSFCGVDKAVWKLSTACQLQKAVGQHLP